MGICLQILHREEMRRAYIHRKKKGGWLCMMAKKKDKGPICTVVGLHEVLG